MPLSIHRITQDEVEHFRVVNRAVVKETGLLPMVIGIRDIVDRKCAFVGYAAGIPVAILTVSKPVKKPDALKIDQLGAWPTRYGYGSEMFVHAIQLAKDEGKDRLILAVRKDNPNAIRFYETRGMELVGETRTGKLEYQLVLRDPNQEQLF